MPALAQNDAQIDVRAGAAEATKTRVVKTADLNLANPADRRVLDRRLRVAANAVCDVWDVSDARPASGFTACADAALSAARVQLGQRAANDGAPIRVSAI